MKKNWGYAGKIQNSSTQVVEAPNKPQSGRGKASVIRGGDLRCEKGKK